MKTQNDDHKKTVKLGGIILIVLILAGLGGLYYWLDSLKYVYTDDAALDGDHVSVSAKTLGRIQKLTVDEGDKVEQNQLLVQLDDTDLRAQENQANTGLVSAEQNVNLSKVNLNRAQDDFVRTESQFKSGFASKEEYDHAKSTLDAAKVAYSIAVTAVNNTQAQLGVIQTQLQNTKIVAPLSGFIAKRSVMPGEVVQPGQVIFLINDLQDIWITANYEETKISKVQPGETVEVYIDAYPGHSLKGKVVQVGAKIKDPPFQISDTTKTTQKVPVKILLNQVPESMHLLPGMSVETKIKIK
jgi:RND family efflux transporter, MFP subunit